MTAGIPAPGYQISPETRPGRVRLQVSDLDRSVDYYERVLGLRTVDRTSDRASLGATGAAAPFVELHEWSGARPTPPGGRPGLYHFAILLPDRSDLGRFLRHLQATDERTGAADHRVSEAIYLRDPDGLGIEVYADRPRSAWRHRGRQLIMTTEPLDLAALVEAGETGTWRGMPPGSRIGHLHLHVGDLEVATELYHRALGLDQTVWSYPGALFLSAGGYHHHLGLNTWAREPSPPAPDEARLLEWELLLPSEDAIAGVKESLAAGGFHLVDEDGPGAVVRDPWGTALRLRTPA